MTLEIFLYFDSSRRILGRLVYRGTTPSRLEYTHLMASLILGKESMGKRALPQSVRMSKRFPTPWGSRTARRHFFDRH